MSLTCMILAFHSAQGQLTIGAAGNLITSNWTEDYDDAKSRLSFSIGGAGLYDINDRIAVGAELLYASIGPTLDDPDEDLKGRVAVSVIQIPLFVNVSIIEGLKAHAGFQPGLILSSKTHVTDGPFEGEYDESDEYGALAFDFILGASYDITDDLTGVFRIDLGLNDMTNELEEDPAVHSGIVLGVRYWFWRNE